MDNKKHLVYFPNLDALRFFCFLSVFFFHSFSTNLDSIKANPVFDFIKDGLFGNGFLGVNFFFVLSGFLITYLLLVEKNQYNKIHSGKFYMRRILRIWPLFYFCVLFGFVIFPIIKRALGYEPNETASVFYYISFLNNFDTIKNGHPDSSVLGILWSVAIEEQFYLVWPLIIGFINTKRLPLVFTLIIIGSFIFRVFNAKEFVVLNSHTISCISDMTIGGLGAYLSLYSTRFKRFIETIPKPILILLYFTALIFYLFRAQIFENGALLMAAERLIFSILFVIIILEQNFANNSIFKFKSLKRTSMMGKYTYGLYCLHPIALLVTDVILSKAGLNQTVFQIIVIGGVISLLLVFLMAFFSFHYFERFFLSLKNRYQFVKTSVNEKSSTHA